MSEYCKGCYERQCTIEAMEAKAGAVTELITEWERRLTRLESMLTTLDPSASSFKITRRRVRTKVGTTRAMIAELHKAIQADNA